MSEALNSPAIVPIAQGLPGPEEREVRRVVEAVRYLNRMEFSDREENRGSYLAFAYEEKLQRMVVKVLDRTTGETMYQIPAPEVVRMAIEARRKAADARGASDGG